MAHQDGQVFNAAVIDQHGIGLDGRGALFADVGAHGLRAWALHLGADFWLRIAEAYMHDITNQTFAPLHFVVSDVRFQNEADWVRQRGGVIWRVDRPGTAGVREHVSEQGATAIKADAVLVNNSSIEDLSILVGHVLQRGQP
jgi:hypothetical protein